jgi:predicted DNA-binding protein with PD1-like motif
MIRHHRKTATLEVIITESPAHLHKVKDQATGLALIRANS